MLTSQKFKELFKKNNVHVFSSNYALYGDMSYRVMTLLATYSPDIEIYSIDEAFLDVLKDKIAGDPMDEDIRWTHLTQLEIRKGLAEQHGIIVSKTVVQQLLAKHGFRRRKAQKN